MGCEAHCNALHMIIAATEQRVSPVALTHRAPLSRSALTLDVLLPAWLPVFAPADLLMCLFTVCLLSVYCLPVQVSVFRSEQFL